MLNIDVLMITSNESIEYNILNILSFVSKIKNLKEIKDI